MSKKRVYELAKEMGIENKELISHLEKLGIAVKSHSSTLEDSDVQRIQQELFSSEPRKTVEERIKPTVIRRRIVRQPFKEEIIEVVAEKTETALPEVPERKVKREESVSQEITQEVLKEEPVASQRPEERQYLKIETEEEKKEAPHAVPPPARKTAKEEMPSAPKFIPKKEEAPLVDRKQGQQIPEIKEVKKELPQKPESSIIKKIEPPRMGVEEKPKLEEADKFKKKGNLPVEVMMEEQAPRKKPFIKKILDKKESRFIETAEEGERLSRWRSEKKTALKMKKTLITIPKAIKRRIKVGEAITIAELAKKMAIKANEVITKLIGLGLMVNINQSIDFDTATLIASDFGYQVEFAGLEYDEAIPKIDSSTQKLQSRAPVVTIMGHVDHGKTSLLDAIRQTNVIEGEAGGITQAIGAYHVHIKDRDIVFLDTPGHEAFTAMRARGAKVTDIVVLVVAADDGVMGQTVEAINHARVAGVPIIVAINKIDKPGADPGRIKQSLTEYNLVPEEWGGETIFCEVSAKKKLGIESLLEMILLQADMMELKADHNQPAQGVIIEAKLDRGRGPVATVLIQEGTLREGDTFVSKTEFGRVRALINDQGARIKDAGPSMPVEVIGFSGVPQVGSQFICVEDEKKAKSIGEYWIRKEREREFSAFSKITLEQLYQKIKEGFKDFNVIIKGDVQGSIEALTEALSKLSTPDVKLKIIHSSTGAISETDVMLASASNAIIIGFNVRPDSRVMEVAEKEGVEIKLYDVIYNVISDIKAAMEGLLEPVFIEVVQGRAEVRDLFKIPKVGTIAGCYIMDGKIARNANLKLVRDGIVIYDGKISSLKRFKDDIKEVNAGFECGIGIENFNDLRVGDVMEAYLREKESKKLP
jgi:translation initiation factor IF-2